MRFEKVYGYYFHDCLNLKTKIARGYLETRCINPHYSSKACMHDTFYTCYINIYEFTS